MGSRQGKVTWCPATRRWLAPAGDRHSLLSQSLTQDKGVYAIKKSLHKLPHHFKRQMTTATRRRASHHQSLPICRGSPKLPSLSHLPRPVSTSSDLPQALSLHRCLCFANSRAQAAARKQTHARLSFCTGGSISIPARHACFDRRKIGVLEGLRGCDPCFVVVSQALVKEVDCLRRNQMLVIPRDKCVPTFARVST